MAVNENREYFDTDFDAFQDGIDVSSMQTDVAPSSY